MPSWSGCRVEVVGSDGSRAFGTDDGDVRLDEQGLAVSYFDDAGPVVLAAENDGSGHFRLVCRSRPRTATLHRFPDDPVLVGAWSEDEAQGFWRVVLRGAPG